MIKLSTYTLQTIPGPFLSSHASEKSWGYEAKPAPVTGAVAALLATVIPFTLLWSLSCKTFFTQTTECKNCVHKFLHTHVYWYRYSPLGWHGILCGFKVTMKKWHYHHGATGLACTSTLLL